MKYLSLFVVLFVFACSSPIANASTSSFQKTLESKVNISDADAVVEKANKNYNSVSSPYSAIFSDPLVNSTLNGYGNMLQGSTGGGCSAQELNRQQLDYARQQMEYADDSK